MEKLTTNLSSDNFKKEKRKAYLVSMGIGIGVGVLMTIFSYFGGFDFLFIKELKGYEFIKFLVFSNLFPISVLFLLFILSKKIFTVWEKIKTRILCVAVLSIVCIYSYDFIYLITSNNALYKAFFLPIWMFFGIVVQFIEYPLKLLTFLCSNIFTVIIAAYLATKGITNLSKRIILFLVIGFLISITAGISFIIGGVLT